MLEKNALIVDQRKLIFIYAGIFARNSANGRNLQGRRSLASLQ
jgi:hypothetical protein